MKPLMLTALCILSVCVFAQSSENRNQQSGDTLKNFKGSNPDVLPKQFQDYLQRKNAPNNLLANKQGNVMVLPQDHMPCIVPNTNGISKMPNAWGTTSVPYVSQSGAIPNPALPKQQSFELKIDNSLDSQSK
jgi:hypothetical protein